MKNTRRYIFPWRFATSWLFYVVKHIFINKLLTTKLFYLKRILIWTSYQATNIIDLLIYFFLNRRRKDIARPITHTHTHARAQFGPQSVHKPKRLDYANATEIHTQPTSWVQFLC